MRLKPVIYCFLLNLRLKLSGSNSLLKYAFAQKPLLISYMIVVTHHNKGVLIYIVIVLACIDILVPIVLCRHKV